MNQEVLWYWFLNIPGIGPVSRQLLLKQFDNLMSLWSASEIELKPFLKSRQLTCFIKSRNEQLLKTQYLKMMQGDTLFLSCQHSMFPRKLNDIPNPPLGLYVRGTLPAYDKPLLAVVGTRHPTPYGKEVTRYFLEPVCRAGVGIISGLAAGIDTLAHQIALREEAYTAGILGGGIDTIYPRENFNLYRTMYEKGCVISEHKAGTPNRAGLFPLRNRIISGLADAVLIIEAAEKSGSLITADHALEQGKDIYVIPGRITDPMSRGCNHLISQGAQIAESPEQILENIVTQYAIHTSTTSKMPGEHSFDTPLEEFIFHTLDFIKPHSANDILHALPSADYNPQNKVDISDILLTLLHLEMKKSVAQISHGLYVKKC